MKLSLPVFPFSCVLFFGVAACEQTDVVAVDEALCLFAADCDGDGMCPARSCDGVGASAPVQVGDGCSADDPTAPTFRFALCSCDDYVSEAPLVVDTRGDGAAASVGVNGTLTLGAGASIDGSLQVAGAIETGDGPAVSATGEVLAAANLACNCQPDNLLDVAAVVAAARDDNDNAAQGVDARVLDGFTSAQTQQLNGGKLYLSRIAGSAPLTLEITGHVRLYAAANVELDSSWTITLATGASLDLFIAGNVRAGALAFGDAGTAGWLRVYVGGAGTINLEDASRIGGALYAPTTELVTRGPFESDGPLFVRRAAPGDEVRVHFDPLASGPPTCD